MPGPGGWSLSPESWGLGPSGGLPARQAHAAIGNQGAGWPNWPAWVGVSASDRIGPAGANRWPSAGAVFP